MPTEGKLDTQKSQFMRSIIHTALILSITFVINSCGSATSDSKDLDSSLNAAGPSKSTESEDEQDSQLDSGCPNSTREAPLMYETQIVCERWTFTLGKATLVPNDVITNSGKWMEDVFADRSRVVIQVNLKYTGEGTGDLRDVFPYFPFLLGEKLKTYELNSNFGESFESLFGPRILHADEPYSGGEVQGALWFLVDNDDRNFVLATKVGDYPYNHDGSVKEPNLWIDVTS